MTTKLEQKKKIINMHATIARYSQSDGERSIAPQINGASVHGRWRHSSPHGTQAACAPLP